MGGVKTSVTSRKASFALRSAHLDSTTGIKANWAHAFAGVRPTTGNVLLSSVAESSLGFGRGQQDLVLKNRNALFPLDPLPSGEGAMDAALGRSSALGLGGDSIVHAAINSGRVTMGL